MRFNGETAHGQCSAEVIICVKFATVVAQCPDPKGSGSIVVWYVIGSPFPNGSLEEVAKYLALLAFSHMNRMAKVIASKLTFGPGQIEPNTSLQVIRTDSEG
jgi:hypothetical protein